MALLARGQGRANQNLYYRSSNDFPEAEAASRRYRALSDQRQGQRVAGEEPSAQGAVGRADDGLRALAAQVPARHEPKPRTNLPSVAELPSNFPLLQGRNLVLRKRRMLSSVKTQITIPMLPL